MTARHTPDFAPNREVVASLNCPEPTAKIHTKRDIPTMTRGRRWCLDKL